MAIVANCYYAQPRLFPSNRIINNYRKKLTCRYFMLIRHVEGLRVSLPTLAATHLNKRRLLHNRVVIGSGFHIQAFSIAPHPNSQKFLSDKDTGLLKRIRRINPCGENDVLFALQIVNALATLMVKIIAGMFLWYLFVFKEEGGLLSLLTNINDFSLI
jgi:hypothetical protein